MFPLVHQLRHDLVELRLPRAFLCSALGLGLFLGRKRCQLLLCRSCLRLGLGRLSGRAGGGGRRRGSAGGVGRRLPAERLLASVSVRIRSCGTDKERLRRKGIHIHLLFYLLDLSLSLTLPVLITSLPSLRLLVHRLRRSCPRCPLSRLLRRNHSLGLDSCLLHGSSAVDLELLSFFPPLLANLLGVGRVAALQKLLPSIPPTRL